MSTNNKPKPKKINPYNVFNTWLHNDMPDPPFPQDIISALNKRSVLAMMGKLDNITVFLNKHFNNYTLMQLDDIEFYKFIRQIYKRFRVGKYETSFFKHEKQSLNLKQLHVFFPCLKRYEVEYFLNAAKKDPEYNSLAECIGLGKIKKKKLTKKEKMKLKSTKEPKPKKQKGDEPVRSLTWGDWVRTFGLIPTMQSNVFFQEVKDD